MGYCYHCGHELILQRPPEDDRLRETCPQCHHIHYTNPRILVSCIVHSDSKILWIRRGLSPGKGLWAMPAGFMEQGESLQQAAVRELSEETGLIVDPNQLNLCVLSSLTFINEVYVVFRCFHPECDLTPPSNEVQQLAFLTVGNAPWESLAYPDTENYMRDFYRDIATGDFNTYLGEFSRRQHGLEKVQNSPHDKSTG